MVSDNTSINALQHCGTRLWQDISRNHAEIIQTILWDGISESVWQRRCQRNRGFTYLFANIITNMAPQSAAGRRYTPTIAGSSQSVMRASSQGTGAISSPNNQPTADQTANQVTHPGANTTSIVLPAPQDSSRILFGVKGPDPALKLEQIEIRDAMNDSNFYDELRKYYRLNRGRFRYWFSFWRLGYCEVVKARHDLFEDRAPITRG